MKAMNAGTKLLGPSGSMFGARIFDWKKIKQFGTEAEVKTAIFEAVNDYVKELTETPHSRLENAIEVVKAAGMKLSGADANLMGANPVAMVLSNTVKGPDRGYELLFTENDMRSATADNFELIDVTGGVTFYQQAAGEEAKLSKIPTSAKTLVGMLRFTGGYNLLDDWLRFNQYYKIDALTADTISRWYDKRATTMYGLLTALAAGINEIFVTDDITTINNACAQILTDLEAAGYVVDENSEFVISCNPKLKMRVMKAIAAAFMNPNTNNSQLQFNISAVVSTTKLANTSYYVSLPGGKNQRGEWEDLNLRPAQRNELILGAAHVWTGAYNAIIGESKQHRRCALA